MVETQFVVVPSLLSTPLQVMRFGMVAVRIIHTALRIGQIFVQGQDI